MSGNIAPACAVAFWKIRGKTERFDGKFSKDRRTLTGVWERRRGSKWTPWMEITLNRAK